MATLSSYKTKDTIELDGFSLIAYNNVLLGTNDLPEILLDGNWFIVDCTDEAYYHFLFDNVGQYYALAEVVDNLNVIILLPNSDVELKDYLDWCIDKISNEVNCIQVCLETDGILNIEKLYVASNRLIPAYSLIESDRYDLLLNDKYQDMVVPALRKFLLRNLPKRSIREKIYASRRDKSQELHDRVEFFEFLRDNDVTWDNGLSDPHNVLFDPPEKFKHGRVGRIIGTNLAAVEMDTYTRLLSNQDESLLENFLIQNGYSVMPHTDISFEDQMSAIAACKSYVCYTGASVLNSVVCPEDANITIVNLNTNWPMPNHEYTPTIINNNVHVAFSTRKFPNQVFSMTDVLSEIRDVI